MNILTKIVDIAKSLATLKSSKVSEQGDGKHTSIYYVYFYNIPLQVGLKSDIMYDFHAN